MRSNIITGAIVAAMTLSASAAMAQTAYRSHPYGTTHSLNTGGYDDYQATAPQDDYADQPAVRQTQRVAPTPAPDYGKPEAVPEYFMHAQGTMSTP